MALDSLDPVQANTAQLQSLRLAIEVLTGRIDAMAKDIKECGTAIDDMRANITEDVEEGAAAALNRLTHDSERGRPYWETGADHLSRRWYDVWSRWLGGWLTKLIGGAALTAAVVWYVSTNGGKK